MTKDHNYPPCIGESGPMTSGDCARWLEAKYSRHHELEDQASAQMIRNQAEEIHRLRAIIAGNEAHGNEPRAALTLDNGEIPTLRLWHKRSIETCMATGDREGVAWHRKRFAYFDKATDSTNQDGQQAPAPSGNAGLGTTGGASSLHQSSEKS